MPLVSGIGLVELSHSCRIVALPSFVKTLFTLQLYMYLLDLLVCKYSKNDKAEEDIQDHPVGQRCS